MRKDLEVVMGAEFRSLAIATRERMHLTQKEMGVRLCMSESSYSDIETGRSHCGLLTAVLLLNLQEDPREFLQFLDEQLQKCNETEPQLV